MTRKVVIYARVSTPDQNVEGQAESLVKYAERNGYEVVKVYKDVRSGKNADRPSYKEMMEFLRSPKNRQGVSILIVKLDRIMRSTLHLSYLADQLTKWKVPIVTMDQGEFDFDSSVGMLYLNILSAMAEFERSLISERTIEGLRNSKNKGGRPKTTVSKSEVDKLHSEGMSYVAIASKFGVTKQTIYNVVHKGHGQA